MRRRLIRRTGPIVAAIAFGIVALAWAARLWQAHRLAQVTPAAEAFLDRAIAGDSLGLAALATNAAPIQRMLTMQRVAPEALVAVRRTLRLEGGTLEGDRAIVTFRTEAPMCPKYLRERGEMQFQFTRVGTAWLIDYAAPRPC